MIELTSAQAITIGLSFTGVLIVLAGWIYRLGSRLATGSEKIKNLSSEIDGLKASVTDIIRVNTDQDGDIAKLDNKMGDRFNRVEIQLARVGTVLELLYSDLRGKKPEIDLANGDTGK